MVPEVKEVDLFLALLRLTSGAPATCHAEWNGSVQSFSIRCSRQARKILAWRLSQILARAFNVADEIWLLSQEEALAVIAASHSSEVS